MKKVLIFCLFLILLSHVLFGETSPLNQHPVHFPIDHQQQANDRDYYQPIIMPYLLGLFTSIAMYGALGMNMFYWEISRDWDSIGEWEFYYEGDLIGSAQWELDEMLTIYTNTIDGGKITETLVTMDFFGTEMDTEQYFYTYSGDQLTSWLGQTSDYMGGWVNSQQGSYVYSGDLMTEYTLQMWSPGSRNWVNLHRYVVDYIGDNIDEMLQQNWDGEWQDYYLSEHSYNGSQLDVVINYLRVDNNWEYDLKETYNYNRDMATTILIEEWFNGNWSNYEYITNTIENDKLEETLIEEWSGSDWVNLTFTDYIYSLDNGGENIPSSVLTLSNYPNPFNPETTIYYQLPENDHVSLAVYNIQGRLVKILVDEENPAGDYTVSWDGTDHNNNPVPSGLYFYKITADGQTRTRKMMLLK